MSLQNFRVFQDRTTVNFAQGKNKNVTLFVANNATGKTTFAQAIEWCLFGKCEFKSDLLSNGAAKVLQSGMSANVEVNVTLEHRGNQYKFTREAVFLKNGSEKIEKTNEHFTCYIKTLSGETKPAEAEDELKRAVPDKLVRFIFFDGERIDKMSRRFQGQKQTEEIESAVSDLLGMKVWENAVQHLIAGYDVDGVKLVDNKKQGYQSVARYFERNYEKLIDIENDSEILRKIEGLEQTQQEHEEDREKLTDRIEKTKEAIESYQEQIRENDEASKLQIRRDHLKDLIESSQTREDGCVETMKKSFQEKIFELASLKLANRAVKLIKAAPGTERDIPGITADTINFLLKRGRCICGSRIDGHLCNELTQLKKYIPPESISGLLGAFVNWFDVKYQNSTADQLRSDLKKNCETIREEQNKRERYINDLRDISDKLISGSDYSQIVKMAEMQIRKAQEDVEKWTREIGEIDGQLKLVNSAKNDLKNRLQNNTKVSKEAMRFKISEEYAKELGLLFFNDINKKKQYIRSQLNEHVRAVFKKLSKVDYIPTIDENYQFSCTTSDGAPIDELSSSQSMISVLAVVAGTISLGQKIVAEDNKQSDIIETVPLVMDAPISAFDSDRIDSFADTIPCIAEQLILLVKNPEGERVTKRMRDKIGKLYVIENVTQGDTTKSKIMNME